MFTFRIAICWSVLFVVCVVVLLLLWPIVVYLLLLFLCRAIAVVHNLFVSCAGLCMVVVDFACVWGCAGPCAVLRSFCLAIVVLHFGCVCLLFSSCCCGPCVWPCGVHVCLCLRNAVVYVGVMVCLVFA